MNTKWKSSTQMLALALLMSTPAFARHKDPPPPGAPEVDPSLAIAGISFLGGSLAVLRSRRRK